MNILTIGANGQLGTDLAKEAGTHPDFQYSGLDRLEMDVSDIAMIQKVLEGRQFDVLINCTSYHKTDEVESNADKAFKINAFAVRAMAEACARKKARFLHISTDYVFSGESARPYYEADAPCPLNVYGSSKLMGEGLARLACSDTLIFRVASLFGVAGASGKGGNFVETMIRVGKEKGQLRVISDQVMSPTGSADVAQAIFKSLAKRIPAGTYHAVNSGQASWHEFAGKIIELAGVSAKVDPIPATAYPLPARRPAFSVLDNTRLSTLIGPIPAWPDALRRYMIAKGHIPAAV